MNVNFSILIPAFKKRYFRECLESCLNQIFTNYEVIVVDDDSPENLKSIVDNLSDSRIRFYRNEKNCGAVNVVDNWNICLSYAKGDYVICMGDDDRLLPNCLEEYYKLICKYPDIGLLHGWTEIINEKSQPILATTHRCEYESAISLMWHRNRAYSHQFIGDFCFKRDWLLSNGGFYKLPLAWGSDDISAIIGASKNGVANTQTVVFQYRINSNTISNTGNIFAKIDAVCQRFIWEKEYLSVQCIDPCDELYRIELLNGLRRSIEKKKGLAVASDLRHKSLLRILFWIIHRKKYKIDFKAIVFAITIAYK